MTAAPARTGSLRELDWLMVAVVCLCCLGLVMAVSISGPRPDVGPLPAMREQGTKLFIGLVAFMVAATVPLGALRRGAVPLFLVGAGLCVVALLFDDSHGARRWIRIGGSSFQPVDLARLSLIVLSAATADRAGRAVAEFRRGFVAMMAPAAVLSCVLLLQPDVGNAVFTLTLAGVMAVCGGVSARQFAIAGSPLLVPVLWTVMHRGYVQDRLLGFLNVETGSQVWQSMVAISSGGVLGRGLGDGWMKMGFVPEAGNDFVFAVIGEELGLAGGLCVLALYSVIGCTGLRLVLRMEDPFRRLLVLGSTFAICMQAAINLLVVTGMAPAKGIDLPFLSSGGTNLLFSLSAIGIIGNAARSDPAWAS